MPYIKILGPPRWREYNEIYRSIIKGGGLERLKNEFDKDFWPKEIPLDYNGWILQAELKGGGWQGSVLKWVGTQLVKGDKAIPVLSVIDRNDAPKPLNEERATEIIHSVRLARLV